MLTTPDDGNGSCPTCGQPTSLSASPPPPATDGDALREALIAMVEHRSEVAKFLWRTWIDGDWVWNDDMWAACDPEEFNLILAARDVLASSPPLAATDAVEAERAVSVSASRIIACRDAFVASDPDEAYHQLRMMVDPDCEVHFRTGDHWTDVEARARGTDEVENG